MVGVSPATVRVWERDGLVTTSRSASGYRYFGEEDLARLRRVAHLRRVDRLSTAGIRRVLADEGHGRAPASRRDVALGPRLRRMRQDRGLTLEQVADAVGLSPSFLSELERDQSGASMTTLHRLLGYYGTTVAAILEGARGHAPRPRRRGRGRSVRQRGVLVEPLGSGQTVMEPRVLTVEPGAAGEGAADQRGEQFVYVLEGALEVTLSGRERYVLRQGDSLCCPGGVVRAWRNPGRSGARVLWVSGDGPA